MLMYFGDEKNIERFGGNPSFQDGHRKMVTKHRYHDNNDKQADIWKLCYYLVI